MNKVAWVWDVTFAVSANTSHVSRTSVVAETFDEAVEAFRQTRRGRDSAIIVAVVRDERMVVMPA